MGESGVRRHSKPEADLAAYAFDSDVRQRTVPVKFDDREMTCGDEFDWTCRCRGL